MAYDVSAQALRPLFDTFWSSEGWRHHGPLPADRVPQAAVDSGVMFRERVRLDHDGWVGRARAAVGAIRLCDVGEAFISSLTSRRLDLRSALGSFAVARHLSAHPFTPSVDRMCAVCGLWPDADEDFNVLNFERFKWGGVRRECIAYAAFDLEQFVLAPLEPLAEDAVGVARSLFDVVRSAPSSETATKVATRLQMIKANKDEREVLMDILGVCGVLATVEHPGFRKEFIHFDSRPLPDYHFVERAYPVCWWRAANGVDDVALREFLPQLV